MLELQKVSKVASNEHYIYETSLKLQSGVFNILLGPTGSGKTTLMRLMAGLDQPTTGHLLFDDVDVSGQPVQKRNVAMVYQQFINFPNMTIFENIASPLRLQKMSQEQITQRVKDTSELLKLTPYLDRLPSELSGGQQQRTALARALVKKARLILLDEPLVNLDYKLREELREELPQIFKDAKTTVVYATTEPTEALLFGGYTAVLKEGAVTQYGETHQVYRNPCDLKTAQGFADPPLNLLQAKKQGQCFLFEDQSQWNLAQYSQIADGEYIFAFHPYHLALQQSENHTIELLGKVIVSEISGSESYIHLDMSGFPSSKIWVIQAHGVHNLEAGSSIHVYLKPESFLVFDQQGQRVFPQ